MVILEQPFGGGVELDEVVDGGMEPQDIEVVVTQGVHDGFSVEGLQFEMEHVDAREAQIQQLMEENQKLKKGN